MFTRTSHEPMVTDRVATLRCPDVDNVKEEPGNEVQTPAPVDQASFSFFNVAVAHMMLAKALRGLSWLENKQIPPRTWVGGLGLSNKCQSKELCASKGVALPSRDL